MNNTIPFHSATHAPQITVDVNILSMLKQAASCLSEMASENVYLAAIGPDMELTIIMEEDAPSILPCFDEGDALISVKGAPLFISYNPAQVLKLAGKRYLTGPVIFYRTDGHSTIVSLTVEDALMKNKIIGICPNCGANVVEREKGWFCENRECRFVLWKDNAFLKRLGKRMDAHVADKLLRDGRVRLKDCKSAKGKTYNATVLLGTEPDGRSKFSLEFEGGC